MPNIFISYRRDDTADVAGRLSDALKLRFGANNVFRDIYDLRAGVDYKAAIQETIGKADVVLVLIGKQWLTLTDTSGQRRIDDHRDLHRHEIAAALQRPVELVIPVLVDDAPMPAAVDLPEELAPLADRNACELADKRWDYDLGKLLASMQAPESRAKERPPLPKVKLLDTWSSRILAGVSLFWASVYSVVAVGYSSAPDYAIDGPGDLRHSIAITLDNVPKPDLSMVESKAISYPVLRKADVAEPDGPGFSVYYFFGSADRGTPSAVVAIDGGLHLEVTDARRLKPSGAWPYIGKYKSLSDWIMGAIFAAMAIVVIALWAPLSMVRGKVAATKRPPNPFARAFAVVLGHPFVVGLASATVIGLVLLAVAPGWNRARKLIFLFRWIAVVAVLSWLAEFSQASGMHDVVGQVGLGLQAAAVMSAWAVGWFMLRPEGRALSGAALNPANVPQGTPGKT